MWTLGLQPLILHISSTYLRRLINAEYLGCQFKKEGILETRKHLQLMSSASLFLDEILVTVFYNIFSWSWEI